MTCLRGMGVLVVLAIVVGTTRCSSKSRRSEATAEAETRETFARALAIDGGIESALFVASRADVLFEEGFSIISYNPPDDFRGSAFRWMGQRAHARVHSHGNKAMHIGLHGWVNEKVIRAKPVITVYLEGQRMADTGAIEAGLWGIDVRVPAEMVRDSGWMDMVITVSTVAFHWGDPPDLRVVVLNSLEWWETR